MTFELRDCISLGELLALLAIYGRLRVMAFQHSLMWKSFARTKGIDANGESKSPI